jgi:hypothetical protein
VIFVELPQFTEAVIELVDDASYIEFQKELLAMPDRGDVMQGSGGLMKVRMRLPGRGKSGGGRVIYLYLKQHNVIILFYLYTKAKSETLTVGQLKSLKTAVAVIKKQFRP